MLSHAAANVPFLREFDPEAEWPVHNRPHHNESSFPELWESVLLAIALREPNPREFLEKNGEYYRVALHVWQRLMGDMPLGSIDETTLSQWRTKRMQLPGRNGKRRAARKRSAAIGAASPRCSICCIRCGSSTASRRSACREDLDPGDEPVILDDTWSQLYAGCKAWQFTRDRRIPDRSSDAAC